MKEPEPDSLRAGKQLLLTAAHSWHSPASIKSTYLLFIKNEANYLWFYCPLS